MPDRRPEMNDCLPCGTDAGRRRHLAHGEDCPVCGTSATVLDPPSKEKEEVAGRDT